VVVGTGEGTCHVQLTYASGATSAGDVTFMNADPNGCGQALVAATPQLSFPGPMCDAGLDAAPSE
jgi:hypothetical protein